MNYKTALAEQIDDMAESLEYWKDAHKRAMDKEVDLQQELDDLKTEIRTKRTLYLDLLEERDSLVIEVNELTSTNKELWTTIKSLPTIAEDALVRKLKENEDEL
jgi:flagellar hook-associated protein FlgK